MALEPVLPDLEAEEDNGEYKDFRRRFWGSLPLTLISLGTGATFVYNAIGVPIAAGVLYPAFGLVLSPIIAALAMSLSSASVVGNALRQRNSR